MWGDMGDRVGYSGIQRDTAGYSGIQRDMADIAGYPAGYSRGMQHETAGDSGAIVGFYKNILQSSGYRVSGHPVFPLRAHPSVWEPGRRAVAIAQWGLCAVCCVLFTVGA